MASSSNPSPLKFTHDVFVSYMHVDTGNSFTSHLKSAFDREGFNVAMNDTVDKGKDISDTLLSNISESVVCVVVFSKSYSASAQCLDELVKIWESKGENGGRVLPVFLGVEPTHVRNQTGAFGDGFQRLIESKQFKEKEETWKSALMKTANLCGWDSMVKSEAEILDAVVECITKTLDQLPSRNYSNGSVGIYQVEAVESLLQLQSKTNVQFLGIWGMGGIGKTRISKELWDRISSLFDAACFLEKVGQKLGSTDLQFLSKEIFSQLGIDFKPSLPRSAQRALNRKRVLIILDDGSDKIELISVDLNEGSRNMYMKREFFEQMNQLRILNLHHGRGIIQLPEGLSSLPNMLSLFRWDYCPLTSFPEKFPNHLVELRLIGSRLKQLWSEGAEPHLPLLECINLSWSEDFIKLPDLSKCPNLKTLNVMYCVTLVEIPSSFQHLSKLQTLDMDWCYNLTKLPVLPQSIVSLLFSGTKIEELPSRIGSLSQLERESLPASIEHLSCLTELFLTECKNLKSLPFLPSSLKALFAEGCTSLESLPASMKHLSQLEELYLEECKNLKFLPDLPSSLKELDVNGCTTLTTVGKICGEYDGRSFNFNMGGCFNLDQNSRIIYLDYAQARLSASETISSFRDARRWALLPGSEVPGWFKYKAEGSSIEVELLGEMLLKHQNRFALCVVIDDCSNILEESFGKLFIYALCTCAFATKGAELSLISSRNFIHRGTGGKAKHVVLWVKPVEHHFAWNPTNQDFSSRMMGSNAKFEFDVRWRNSVPSVRRESKYKIMQCGVSPL